MSTKYVLIIPDGCADEPQEFLGGRTPLEAAEIPNMDAIAAEVIDDVNLAVKVKKSGGSLWLGLSKTMVSVRRYSSLREISSMVTRTAFDQLGYSYPLLFLTLLGLFVVKPPSWPQDA